MEAETLGDTLSDVDAEALVDTLADSLIEVEVERLGDTLGDMDAEALVDTLADWLVEVEAETLGDTVGELLCDVEKPLIEIMKLNFKVNRMWYFSVDNSKNLFI